MNKKWIPLLLGLILLATGGAIYNLFHSPKHPSPLSVGNPSENSAIEAMAKPIELILAKTYLCGLREEERKPADSQRLEQIFKDYQGWEIGDVEQGKLMLLKRENDIAPSCKENGYFGLNEDGILTLFNGLPREQQVIQTFYPINTARMEASLPKAEIEKLNQGIRIHDLAEFNSVLSTFGMFQEGYEQESH